MDATYHAFHALQRETNGSWATLAAFRVTKRRNADQAYAAAEALCKQARELAHRPAAFVQEVKLADYSVEPSIWTASGGEKGVSWIVYTPYGPLDDYASCAQDAWRAAYIHACEHGL